MKRIKHLECWGVKHIAPHGPGEPFESWFARVKSQVSHLPRCVAGSWVHRNWGGSEYDWLPLQCLRFERHMWSVQQVLGITGGVEPSWARPRSEGLASGCWPHATTWLGRYMLENHTWPVPIIVLDNPAGLSDPSGRRLNRHHLLEGHNRYAYFHHLVRSGNVLSEHAVWLASLELAEKNGTARRGPRHPRPAA
jgi:hypothetical protein